MKKKRLQDTDVKEKTVLIRVDYNVPVVDGKIIDDTKIKESISETNSSLF